MAVDTFPKRKTKIDDPHFGNYKKINSYYDYCDYKYGDYLYEDDDMKFIWGMKSYDDLSPGEANL